MVLVLNRQDFERAVAGEEVLVHSKRERSQWLGDREATTGNPGGQFKSLNGCRVVKETKGAKRVVA